MANPLALQELQAAPMIEVECCTCCSCVEV